MKNKLTSVFLCVCPVTENKFHHNILVKVVYGSTATCTLTIRYDEIHDQRQDRRMKNGRQFIKLALSNVILESALRVVPISWHDQLLSDSSILFTHHVTIQVRRC